MTPPHSLKRPCGALRLSLLIFSPVQFDLLFLVRFFAIGGVSIHVFNRHDIAPVAETTSGVMTINLVFSAITIILICE
jgi:hypothetical protein